MEISSSSSMSSSAASAKSKSPPDKPVLQLRPSGSDVMARAKLGTSACRCCGKKIVKNTFRIERSVPNDKDKSKMNKLMYHLECVTDNKEELPSLKKRILNKELILQKGRKEILRERKELMFDLKCLRSRLFSESNERGMALKNEYMVFQNFVLEELVVKLPQAQDELLLVKGIGANRYELYGEAILGVTKAFVDNSNADCSSEEF